MNEFQRSDSEFSGGESNFDVRSLRSVSTNVSDWETWAQFWMHYRLCRSVFILGPIDRMSKGAFTMQFPLSKATPVTDEGAEREGASPRLVLLLRISPESNSGRSPVMRFARSLVSGARSTNSDVRAITAPPSPPFIDTDDGRRRRLNCSRIFCRSASRRFNWRI